MKKALQIKKACTHACIQSVSQSANLSVCLAGCLPISQSVSQSYHSVSHLSAVFLSIEQPFNSAVKGIKQEAPK